MSDSTVSLERLSKAISDGMLALDPGDARIVLSVYRLLARGEPVSPRAVAEAASLDQELVEKRLAEWPGVFLRDGAVIGFWGLALPEMSHRFEIEGKALHTWCAYDALFLPELIGQGAVKRSRDGRGDHTYGSSEPGGRPQPRKRGHLIPRPDHHPLRRERDPEFLQLRPFLCLSRVRGEMDLRASGDLLSLNR